jgi:Holliday junction resolvase
MGKGSKGERKVANWFEDEMGWYAQRTGSSGGATDRHRPDIIALSAAARDEFNCLMIELKSTDPPVRFSREEIKELQEAARRAGGAPYVVINPDLRKFDQRFAVRPRDLKENEKSYTFYPDKSEWKSLEDVAREYEDMTR